LNGASLSGLLACCGVGDCEDNETDDPNVALVPSICLTYCDLKNNMTVYWFAFPALTPKPGCGIVYSESAASQSFLSDVWDSQKCTRLSKSFHQFRVAQERIQSNSDISVWCPPFFMILESSLRCLPLNKSTYDSLTEEEKEQLIFGFVDPNVSSDTSGGNGNAPELAVGWTLRNLVAYISIRLGLGGANAKFLSFRPSVLRRIWEQRGVD
jgi:hypothetical protein